MIFCWLVFPSRKVHRTSKNLLVLFRLPFWGLKGKREGIHHTVEVSIRELGSALSCRASFSALGEQGELGELGSGVGGTWRAGELGACLVP